MYYESRLESPLNVEISTTNGAIEIDLADSTYYEQPFPKLEDIAAVQLALELWSNAQRVTYKKGCSYFEERENKFYALVESLKIPDFISKRMKMLYRCIRSEINCFFSLDLKKLLNHKEDKHLHEPDSTPLSYTDEDEEEEEENYCDIADIKFYSRIVVWKSNCQIDEKKTIEKVLSCRKQLHLYGELVFKIISTYCMEKHVKNFPLTYLSTQFIREVTEGRLSHSYHRMTYFWITSKDPEYQTQPTDFFDELYRSVGAYYFPLQWHAYEYFWDYLTEDQQLTMAKKIISHSLFDLRKHQMELFSKMNRNQLEKIYFEIPFHIISNFCSLKQYELARASWQYAREKFTISPLQFEKLSVQVLEEAKKTGEGMDFLTYLWSSADDSVIEYALIQRQIITVLFLNNKAFEETKEFMIRIFLRKSVEFRKTYILDMGLYFLGYYNEKIFTLIDSCFSQEDQSEIKEKLLVKVIETQKQADGDAMGYFVNLLLWENESFYEYLSWFTSNLNLRLRLKRRLVESKMLKTPGGFFTAQEWSNVSKLINESYSNREQARQRKKKLLYSSVDGCYLFRRWPQPYDETNFTVIDDILRSVLTKNEILSLKQRVIVCFQTALVNGYRPPFRKAHWHRFTSWCYDGDEDRISQFRLSFPIHDAFCPILKETVNSYVKGKANCKLFSSIDELLRWKFPDSNERKKFKELKIHDMMTKNLENIRPSRKYYNEVAEKLVQWFFEEDKTKIKQFKKFYSTEDRVKMISTLKSKRDKTSNPN